MTVTIGRYDQAAGILGGAGEGRTADPGSTSPATMLIPGPGLQWLSPALLATDLIGNGIAVITGWLISHIKPIDELLDKLCGDAAALQEHADGLKAAAEGLGQHADQMVAAGTIPELLWRGDARRGFDATNRAEAGCARAGAPVMVAMADGVIEVGAYIGKARQTIVMVASRLIKDILVQAAKDLKLALLTVGGAVAHFIAWAAKYVATTLRDMIKLVQSVVAEGSTHMGQIAGLGRQLERAAQVLTTGQDPGELQDVAPGSIADRTKGDHQAHDRDLALLASANNDAGDASSSTLPEDEVPEPYDQVTDPAELAALGITPDMLHDDASGFTARVFTDPNTGEVVVAFNGTNFGEQDDVMEDVTGTTVLSPQSQKAMELAQAINSSSRADDVVYTGHSLGGRLASVASMTSGNPAVTFNPAGVSPATQDYFAAMNGTDPQAYRDQINGGQVRTYTTGNDPLTGVQERIPGVNEAAPDAVGLRIRLGKVDNVGAATDPTYGHGMDNVITQYDQTYD